MKLHSRFCAVSPRWSGWQVRRSRFAAAFPLVAALLSGCSKEKVEELANQLKEQATAAMPSSVPFIASGSMALDVGESITTNRGAGQLIFLEGRPAVLKLMSYEPLGSPEFPAIFYQAQFEHTSAPLSSADLVGRTFAGELFVQTTASAPVLFSQPSSPVQIRFDSVEGDELLATISGGELASAAGGTKPLNGSMRILFESPLSGTADSAASP